MIIDLHGHCELALLVQVALDHYNEAGFAINSAKGALQLLTDPEARVRTAVGECLGASARNAGVEIWKLAQKPVLDVIEYCWVMSKAFSSAES